MEGCLLMSRETYYQNNSTGETTQSQEVAMEWHRNGAEIGVYSWSEVLQEMVERITWVH